MGPTDGPGGVGGVAAGRLSSSRERHRAGRVRRDQPMNRQGGRTPMKQSIVASVVAVAAAAAGVILASGLPVGAQGGGTIVGEVKVTGAPPAPRTVKVNKDNEVC